MFRNAQSLNLHSTSRLEAYSDALFSIVATLMVVPISNVELPADEPILDVLNEEIFPKVAIYFFTFLVVSYKWSTHCWLFDTISKIDEFIVLLNLAMLMGVTILPFTFTLLSIYCLDTTALVIFGLPIIALGLMELIFVVHVFKFPVMFGNNFPVENLVPERNKAYFEISTPVIISLIAIFGSILNELFGLCLYILLIFANSIRKWFICIYEYIREKCVSRGNTNYALGLIQEDNSLRTNLLNVDLSKERICTFSDGVFAIVATLIILNICEDHIPTDDDIEKHGSLKAALAAEAKFFLAYAGCFVTVGFQWFVHHSLLHCLEKMNKLMVIFNQLCLLFVGLTPLTFTLTTNFDSHEYFENEIIAIRINLISIFLTGMFQALIWICSLYSQQNYVLQEAWHGKTEHNYMTIKLAVYPILSLITYFVTVAQNQLGVVAFAGMQLSVIAVFGLMSLLIYKIDDLLFGERAQIVPVYDNLPADNEANNEESS